MSQVRKYMLGAVAAAAMSMTSHAATIQLGFVLDGSGSINSTEWNIIRNGLASAINMIPVGGPDIYEVSVVQFSTNSVAHFSNVLLTDATVRGNLATGISGLGQLGGGTNYESGFMRMRDVLNNTIGSAAFSYVNFATDGEPNICGYPVGGGFTDQTTARNCAVAGANALTGIGVDNISIEGIGVTPGNATFLQGSICYPQPCDTTVPFNFPTQGFYIGVADAAGYATAVQNKIRVITQVPEPTTVALVGLALAGLGLARRRKEAQAA